MEPAVGCGLATHYSLEQTSSAALFGQTASLAASTGAASVAKLKQWWNYERDRAERMVHDVSWETYLSISCTKLKPKSNFPT